VSAVSFQAGSVVEPLPHVHFCAFLAVKMHLMADDV